MLGVLLSQVAGTVRSAARTGNIDDNRYDECVSRNLKLNGATGA